MEGSRKAVRRRLGIEIVESRWLLSLTGSQTWAAEPVHQHHSHAQILFVAKLSPSNVVLPLDAQGYQIQGSDGGAMYPLPSPGPSSPGQVNPADPARGTVKFYITGGGQQIDVSITLSRISNVSSIALNDLDYPAVFPLRGATTSPLTQPPALAPNTKPPSPPPVGDYYAGNTVNTAAVAQGQNGQVASSNIGQTVVVLLSPARAVGRSSTTRSRGQSALGV